VQVSLRTEHGAETDRRVPVMATLTPDAIWIQDTWQLRSVPLQGLGIEGQRNGAELALTPGPGPSAEKLTLAFASTVEWERWCREVQARLQPLTPDAPQGDRHQPKGVALVRRAPDVPHVVLGQVQFTGHTRWTADRGLQLRAGIRGADAVIQVHHRRASEVGAGAYHVSGLAVRVEDGDARKRLRLKWYAEEVGAVFNRMLLLLVLQAALLLLAAVFWASGGGLQVPTGQTRSEVFASASLGLGVLYAWPLLLPVLLRVLRWPQLLRTAGLAVLAATTGRGLTVWLAHFLAVLTTGAPLAESKLSILLDPVDWAFVIAGVVLCRRAWRLAADARQILPQEAQVVRAARKVWSGGLLAATGVFALVFLGFVGTARYQASTNLLQPGVDPRREQEALLAMSKGAAQANSGDLNSAEHSLQEALRIWKDLTAGHFGPSRYRANLALTLYNLGWIQERQGRRDEAERSYARAVDLADKLAGDPQVSDRFKQTMASAREALAGRRASEQSRLLDEKEKAAVRKYEEAQVKPDQEAAEADRLCGEAIALWEEILPQATDADYRKLAVARLATAYLRLGNVRQGLGKLREAEAAFRKAIDYGEQAVGLAPDRPLPRHNLQLARQMLNQLQEQEFQAEVRKLSDAQRYADAVELWLQRIAEQEEALRSGRDRATAARRLAYRLDRFAWFLAHCPDARVRDTKEAVRRARRATELQPEAAEHWYTLATVQYRNGDWQDSLASLEQEKTRGGEFDAGDWLLIAMNRHQLNQRAEARDAFGKAVEWIEERKRQAEDNPVLRFQYELMRPGIEALRREAENLLQGKDATQERVG
jgi:tetratricopeptide (TPR) repeat protein